LARSDVAWNDSSQVYDVNVSVSSSTSNLRENSATKWAQAETDDSLW
jgi:hypothetical protein